ncbi:MAG: type II secretion system protein [Planctomycetes bacterium]|nr:type II secretion system protein [Planctomycetota bacterium]
MKRSDSNCRPLRRQAFTLLELLAVVTILGIIAVIVVPRVTTTSTAAKQKAHLHNKAVINAAVERYYVTEGSWPSADLNEMVPPATYDYFPDGLPTNPIDGSVYTIDATTHRVP